MNAHRIHALILHCANSAATASFYTQAFGATRIPGGIAIGAQHILLHPAPSGGGTTPPYPPVQATSFQHFAIVVTDIAQAYAQLRTLPNWTPISRNGPVLLPASSGGVTAFKFRDPDGHPLELLAFPSAKTPPLWQNKPGLFLGIDHTAITVQDTATARGFYAGLGFQPLTGSLNEGEEQAALDGLDNPRVEVTPMALGDAAPHLELLCYRQPPSVSDPAPETSPLATITCLAGPEPARLTDPDGHRVEVLRAG